MDPLSRFGRYVLEIMQSSGLTLSERSEKIIEMAEILKLGKILGWPEENKASPGLIQADIPVGACPVCDSSCWTEDEMDVFCESCGFIAAHK